MANTITQSRYASLRAHLAREQANLIAQARLHRYQSMLLLLAAHPANLTPEQIERAHEYACDALESRSLTDAVETAVKKLKTLQSVGVRFPSTAFTQ